MSEDEKIDLYSKHFGLSPIQRLYLDAIIKGNRLLVKIPVHMMRPRLPIIQIDNDVNCQKPKKVTWLKTIINKIRYR